ncbi:unnamed protein product [Cuscuta campestris]|uniref:diacylglycerol O-acyltransferase n=1 Tax=Cuscuta campestris TaxID=132261 RepID=A0A484M757_9ASTE|nr:unnamed protein product [Cuscuta campestris]
MKWVATKVDLDQHVVVPELGGGNFLLGGSSPDKFMEDYIYNLSKTSLSKAKPLWDLHLLNLKTSDAEAVAILRVHHSLGDGTSLISLLLACTRQTANPQLLPTVPTTKRRRPSAFSGGASPRFWTTYVVRLQHFMLLLWHTLVDVFMFLATAAFLKDSNTPIKAAPGSHFNPRRVVFRTVSLDDFKLIKNAMDMVEIEYYSNVFPMMHLQNHILVRPCSPSGDNPTSEFSIIKEPNNDCVRNLVGSMSSNQYGWVSFHS